MLNWYMLEQLQQARAQALAHEAERQQRIHLARARHQPHTGQDTGQEPRRFDRGLIWLGGRLMSWGSRLQAYGAASQPAVPRTISLPSPTLAPWLGGTLAQGLLQNLVVKFMGSTQRGTSRLTSSGHCFGGI